MRRGLIDASRIHVAETRSISRSLFEKAMFMRCASYYSDAKSELLTQTIFEIEQSKKMVLEVNRSLALSKSLIQEKNRVLEQKVQQRTRELTRANYVLSMLNRCKQLQIRATDMVELLDEICKFIIGSDEYNLVWFNLLDSDDTSRVSCPAAYAMASGNRPERMKIVCHFQADQCLATRAIQSGMIRVYREADPEFFACPVRSANPNCRSLICIPLKTDQAAFGSLNICSIKANGFQENEMLLLEDLASDISCGIHSFQIQEERDRALQTIRSSLREKEAMLREIHHRVRNNFQVVISLLRMQARATGDQAFRAMAIDCEQRIMALAFIHEDLYTSHDLGSIHCQSYFKRISKQLLRAYYQNNVDIHIDAHDMSLSINEAIPCGQIFHELISNALKYAFPNARKGIVRMSMAQTAGNIEWTIEDDGVGLPAGFDFHTHGRMGLELVTLLTEQLGGSIELVRNGGTRWTISFPNSPSKTETKKD